jgi:Protein of unknown function (DUF551)
MKKTEEIAEKHAARLWNSSSCPAKEIVLDAINEALAEQRWIPVSEGLPKFGKTVLAYNGNQVWTAFRSRTFEPEWCVRGGDLRCDDVTHWRPLPAPPEKP